ncbi:MAG: tyrosine-type recombinase/integrase [Bacteroidota bacterium]
MAKKSGKLFDVPLGSVYVRNTGYKKIIIEINKKPFYTGIENTKEGRQEAYELYYTLYNKYLIESGKPPVKQLNRDETIDMFLQYKNKQGRAKSTLANYRSVLFKLIPENAPITPEYLKECADKVNNGEVSGTARTINFYAAAINNFMSYLIDNNMMPDVKIKVIHRRVPHKKPQALSEQEFLSLIEKANTIGDHEYILFLLFLNFSGFRVQEAYRLTWEQIDLANNLITIKNKIYTDDDELFPITKQLRIIIRCLQSMNGNREKLFHYNNYTTLDYKWRKYHGPVDKKYHAIRKKFVSSLMKSVSEGNISINDVKRLARHKDINLTLNIYDDYDIKKLGEKLENTIL